MLTNIKRELGLHLSAYTTATFNTFEASSSSSFCFYIALLVTFSFSKENEEWRRKRFMYIFKVSVMQLWTTNGNERRLQRWWGRFALNKVAVIFSFILFLFHKCVRFILLKGTYQLQLYIWWDIPSMKPTVIL